MNEELQQQREIILPDAILEPSLKENLDRAIQWTWAAIRKRHPDVPDVVLMTAPGGRFQKAGHFAANRWKVLDDDDAHEILIGAEELQRGPLELLDTLLHEAAHGMAYVRKIQDTSRRGHYHNERFAKLATELGLDVEEQPPRGFARTTVPPETAAEYASELINLTSAVRLYRRAVKPPPAAKGDRNYIAAECRCGRRIRTAKMELKPGKPSIICEACGEPFRSVEPDPFEE